ncbi:MAG: bifunctional oligoribonuclease/PAP phosphatase NrnA [Bacteroidales bacterium]|nr:bifunctional oligoribonuclease/PAP phosphatase NrnA [Bacteroidales bacterium]
MNNNIPTESLERLISSADSIVIIGHFNPDGDSIGSITGMYQYLAGRGKNVCAISPSSYPDFLSFLNPKGNPILVYTENKDAVQKALDSADLIICQDLNRLSRTEQMAEGIKRAKAPKVLIDHHPNPEREWFDVVISDTEVSSTCELVFDILMTMPDVAGDTSKLSLECATSLYSGLLTDTNNYSNSLFPDTLTVASALMARGIDSKQIYYNLFCSYSESRMRLMGKMLDNMIIIPEYKTAYMLLSLEDKAAFNFKDGDSEGFVNLPLAIDGIEITALLAQTPDFIRVSLRSKGDINVNDLAHSYFNGGGHVNASGGRLFDVPWSEVGSYFENALACWKKGTTFVK